MSDDALATDQLNALARDVDRALDALIGRRVLPWNLRGSLFLAIEARARLGLQPALTAEHTRIIERMLLPGQRVVELYSADLCESGELLVLLKLNDGTVASAVFDANEVGFRIFVVDEGECYRPHGAALH